MDISFTEHVRLAELHDGTSRWGWRFVGCGSWEGKGEPFQGKDGNFGTGVGKGGERKGLEKTLGLEETTNPRNATSSSARKAKGLPDDLTWVKESLTNSYSPMAPSGSTAQVHPYLFTTSMLELAKEKGAVFVSGKVTSINQSGGKITGVSYSPTTTQEIATIAATEVIVCAGAWSPNLISTLPISGTRAHSVVIRPPSESTIAPYVLFTEITLPSKQVVTPEIYARPDGEVYACGPGDDSPLPPNVDDVEVDQAACQSIRDHVASISQELKHGTVNKHQACFLPVVTSGGGPIIGSADKIAKGLFIATGHTCWVSNIPAPSLSHFVISFLKLLVGHMQCTRDREGDGRVVV